MLTKWGTWHDCKIFLKRKGLNQDVLAAEGQVFYNAGETHPWADERGQGLTTAAAQTKFEEFLKSYYRDFQGQQDYGQVSTIPDSFSS